MNWIFGVAIGAAGVIYMVRTKLSSKMRTLALNASLDPLSKTFQPTPAYTMLGQLLRKNAELKCIKAGPSFAFHNHTAADLTSLYRMVASPNESSTVWATVAQCE